MPKILKNTILNLPRIHSLKIYKKDVSKNYYCSFYVGTNVLKSGNKEISLRTSNLKEARAKAPEVYKDFLNNNLNEILKENKPNFDRDIAIPFFKGRIKKYQDRGKTGNNNQGIREKLRYDNYINQFFKNLDYSNVELMENAISDLVNNLREDKKTENTISKYLNILSLMFKLANRKRLMDYLPEMPQVKIIHQARPSYLNTELNLINKRLKEEFETTKDKFYLEVKDYLNLIRSAGFRPGIQPLMIKNFQYRYLQPDNQDDPILQFEIFNTKTSPKHKLTCHPYFTKNVFPEIVKRNENTTAEDYLLFPNVKNRQQLYAKISKTFTRISMALGLYVRNGQSRPIYSIRHTFITNRYTANAPLEVVARSSNTSEKMIKNFYLNPQDETMIEEHKRLFPTNPTKSKTK